MESRSHETIKDVVFDIIRQTEGLADYERVTTAVLAQFPKSAWKKSHWAYYRGQITSERGRYRDAFSEEIRANLRRRTTPGTQPKDDTIKRIGDKILEHARFAIELAARDDARMRFKLRRWVYARLLQDQNREKRPVKQALWDSGIRACQIGGEQFSTIKGVEIHRKDANEAYSVENCQLVCRKCHEAAG